MADLLCNKYARFHRVLTDIHILNELADELGVVCDYVAILTICTLKLRAASVVPFGVSDYDVKRAFGETITRLLYSSSRLKPESLAVYRAIGK
ncbi:hypothetical protein FBU59_000383 [Linderina macrospora]|uniref:Uncharacterized protein n=1 Tax=Linderina macrospora TaxID=4868 RepID=A0ACC1JH88_9FUNG|nr:hypothetical protein FBU59_000383 [Linderina macrospora]